MAVRIRKDLGPSAYRWESVEIAGKNFHLHETVAKLGIILDQ